MKKIYGIISGMCLFFTFLLSSCEHKGNNSAKIEEKQDPKLILKSLKILGQDLDISDLKNMECTAIFSITTDDITAKFDYGNEEDEAIGVIVEAKDGIFLVDKEKPTMMKITVPAVKGRYLEWTASVTVTIEKKGMPIDVGYNEQIQQNGTEETLQLEVVEFMVQSKYDVIKEVIINDEVKDYKPEIKLIPESPDSDEYYLALATCLLSVDTFKTFTITIKPKDTDIYLDSTYTYRLKGTKIPNNNAEFVTINAGTEQDPDESPNLVCDITWVEGCASPNYEDYGAKSLKMTAHTVSPRASVYVKKVDPLSATEALLEGEQEIKLDNENGVHTKDITLFENKPTKLIAYVKAEDGVTTNDEKGKWQVIFNAVDLFWGYDDSKLGTKETRKTANKAYGEIKAKKADATANKIFIAFGIWDENTSFSPDESIKKMTDYKVLDSYGDPNYGLFTAYQFSVDVSDLNVGQSKEIDIPVMRIADDENEPLDEPIKAFTYKVKITIE